MGSSETINASAANAQTAYLLTPAEVSSAAYNDLILGPQGNSTITLGNGDHTIVVFGAANTISIGNAGTAPGLLGAFSFIGATGGHQTITAGNGSNIIDTAGYADSISVGNGLNLIFATLPGTGTSPVGVGQPGASTVALGTGDNFVYLHGSANHIVEGGGTDAVWGGTAGGDIFTLAASGGVLFVENSAAATCST